jgi:hypothetical protein
VWPSGLSAAIGALALDVRDLAGDVGGCGEEARTMCATGAVASGVGVGGVRAEGNRLGASLPSVAEPAAAWSGAPWKLVDRGGAWPAAADADDGTAPKLTAVFDDGWTDLDRLPAGGPKAASNGEMKLNMDGFGAD